MNILFGLYRADSGEIFWKDQLANFTSPKEAIAAGVGMVQQHFSLVNKMTVLDNVILNLKGNAFVLNRAAARARLVELAEKYGLQVNPDALICELSVGEQQRVEILKALYRNVELLILDEPTGVLTPQETTQFFDVLRNLKNEGYGIIIITHRMSEIMAISDRVTILRDGKQVADLVTAETNPSELSAYMIGRELNESYNIEGTPKAENMLVMKHVSNDHKHHGRHKIEAIDLVIQYWGFGIPMATFIFFNFMKTVPKELDESATIDGASTFRTYTSIIFPLLKPVTVTVIVLDVMWIWNDFLLPLLMVHSNNQTHSDKLLPKYPQLYHFLSPHRIHPI